MWNISHPLGLSPDPNKDNRRINNNNYKTNNLPRYPQMLQRIEVVIKLIFHSSV